MSRVIPETPFRLARRRSGKIAHLPEHIREQINLMLEENLDYKTLIARLGEHGLHLNKDNLSRWRKADHQDWRMQKLWAEAHHDHPEFAATPWALLLMQLQPAALAQLVHRQPSAIFRLFRFMASSSSSSSSIRSTAPSASP